MVDLVEDFGTGYAAKTIAHGLTQFRERQKRTGEPFLSYWAVWNPIQPMTEEEHEKKFWHELSVLATHSKKDWDPLFSPDPLSKRFCFSFDGEAFFVVGLHSQSSRMARRFPFPAIVFNLYSQFEDLVSKGTYDAVVKVNRKREMAYQGNLNPMVEKYADSWETIAFSGRNNPASWVCPFKHLDQSNHA